MKWTKGTIVVGVVLYIFLWVLYLHGATQLFAVLVIPPVLAFLVGGGNFLDDFLGIRRKAQEFKKRSKDE